MPASGPIFIVGSTGCGTSLLRCLLDRHERIAIPRPTGFMRAAGAQAFIPFWPYGERWHRRLGVEDAEFEARLGEFYGSLFRDHAERAGKARWGDATPWHVWHLDALARLFGDARFVGMVRHPGGNVESVRLRLGRTRLRSRSKSTVIVSPSLTNVTRPVHVVHIGPGSPARQLPRPASAVAGTAARRPPRSARSRSRRIRTLSPNRARALELRGCGRLSDRLRTGQRPARRRRSEARTRRRARPSSGRTARRGRAAGTALSVTTVGRIGSSRTQRGS